MNERESLKFEIYVALNCLKVNESILYSKHSEYMPPALSLCFFLSL